MIVARLLYICTFIMVAFPLSAQKRKVQNQPYADYKLYHFGFHVGLHAQDLLLSNNGVAAPNGETWFAEIPDYSPGFSVGVISDLFLNPYMNLRLSPTVHFGDKTVYFRELKNEGEFITSIRSNFLSIPLDLKISSMRLNNYRPYILGGVFGSIDLGRRKGYPLLMKQMDYGFEFGFGCNIYMPYFRLAPEIKFKFGLADILERDRTDLTGEDAKIYSNALSKATSRMIVITFNFE